MKGYQDGFQDGYHEGWLRATVKKRKHDKDMINVSFTEQEIQVLLGFIDQGVRSQGLAAAQNGVILAMRLNAALAAVKKTEGEEVPGESETAPAEAPEPPSKKK